MDAPDISIYAAALSKAYNACGSSMYGQIVIIKPGPMMLPVNIGIKNTRNVKQQKRYRIEIIASEYLTYRVVKYY